MTWAPDPEADGLRNYGNGLDRRIEDTTRCIASVSQGMWRSSQCDKKRGKGPDGLWCGVHNPDRLKLKREAQHAAWREKWRKNEERLDRGSRICARLGCGTATVEDIRLTHDDADALAALLEQLKKQEAS
jgi:hypothetical protein